MTKAGLRLFLLAYTCLSLITLACGQPADLPSIVEDISASVVQVVALSGTGSGFVVDSDGLVLTNAHVVENSSAVEVRFSDGQSYSGNVLGIDEVADLALIKLPAKDLNPVTMGNSDEIMVGEEVIAIGYPTGDTLGASPTITRGIVSTKRSSEITLIQTDAAINPGNSGGPLFVRDGRVVGINTAKLFQLEGIGLAVSINDARERLDRLEQGESIFLNTLASFDQKAIEDSLKSRGSFEKLHSGDTAEWVSGIFGFKSDFNEPVVYSESRNAQFIVVHMRRLNDVERIGVDHQLSDPDWLLNEIINRLSKSRKVEGISTAKPLVLGRPIGDRSAAAWMDVSFMRPLPSSARRELSRIFDRRPCLRTTVVRNTVMCTTYGDRLTRIEVAAFLSGIHVGLVETYYSPYSSRNIFVDEIVKVLETAILSGPDEKVPQDHTKPPANHAMEGYIPVVLLNVVDGDTIVVSTNDKGIHGVQLYGIDAPERGTPAGEKSFNHLRDMLPESLQIRPIDVDECYRLIAEVLPRVAELETMTFNDRQVLDGFAISGEEDYTGQCQ